jgi:GNAT superfamily N-acetyltransferase
MVEDGVAVDIQRCTKADFDFILEHLAEFWGSDRTLSLHHPIFLHEFGDTAYVIRNANSVNAYLFGLFSQTEPTAYVHLVGVHESARRQGLARRLYEHFATVALDHGCTELKAITTFANRQSLAFHHSIGMDPAGDGESADVTKDYAGPGQDRVVMRKRLL